MLLELLYCAHALKSVSAAVPSPNDLILIFCGVMPGLLTVQRPRQDKQQPKGGKRFTSERSLDTGDISLIV